jgi:hypothetical protein
VLAGYRLVVISIYEYNMHREVDELAALLLRKLKLLKEEDCIAVLWRLILKYYYILQYLFQTTIQSSGP